MTRFQKIKSAIKAQNESTKYFNKTFLETFENARETMARNIEKGVDDSYENNGILLYHSYDKVYASDFYNKNGCAYCIFLEIMAGNYGGVVSC